MTTRSLRNHMNASSDSTTLWQGLLAQLTHGSSSQAIFPFIPRPLKWLFLIILFVNIRGLPLTWHIRLFRPAVYFRLYHAIRDTIESPTQRLARSTRLSPVGRDPFTSETVFKTRATPDACDFNIHLSNSSYAMTYDMARFKYVIEHFPFLYRDGGWIALGATHYVFTREIPLNSPYEIRLSIGTWDSKWLYMVARYITYPSSSKSAAKKLANGSSSSLEVPSTGAAINSRARSPDPTLPSFEMPLPPGAVLHCTAVSRLCGKIGRITIPPAIAIATTGFGGISPSKFGEIQSWRFHDHGKRIKAFYAGGWRDVPEGERWWEDTLGGDIERKRLDRLRRLPAMVGIPVLSPAENGSGNE
ncbi:hypothetical protein JB92DRAFT_2815093 [Gautieria morchelliformis]|nr:hypothetical protein JB92DRAFT_2815093 [Gautieria morchelliformis]